MMNRLIMGLAGLAIGGVLLLYSYLCIAEIQPMYNEQLQDSLPVGCKETDYNYVDKDGQTYPIYLHDSGFAFVHIVDKNGKRIRARLPEVGDCNVSICKKSVGNGKYRDFFITNGENGCRFMVYDSSKDKYCDIDFHADDYLNDGVPGMAAFISPDGKYVYVVGDILANSTGWVSTLVIYQVYTKTLKAKLVNSVAAWRLEKDGFTVASETRCTTPDAEFSYQMDFAFEDITYGFDGKVMRKSKEYPSKEIKTRYGTKKNNVKGLGVIRHSFYD